MKEKLLQNLGTQVSFRSLHITDTNFYKGVLTSLTTYEHAKVTRNDIVNYHRVIKKSLHTLPNIENLTWFVITGEDKKQITFAYEWTVDFQLLGNKSYNFTVGKIGAGDPEKINKILKDAGYGHVTIN